MIFDKKKIHHTLIVGFLMYLVANSYSTYTYAQNQVPIDINTFFQLAYNSNTATATIADKVYFPWIENYEIRSETQDFDFALQEYTLRLSPSTPGIRNAQKDLYRLKANSPNFKVIENNCKQLTNVYEDWLQLYFIEKNLQWLYQQDTLLQDKQIVFDRLLGSLDFNLDDLAQLTMDKTDVGIKINELKTLQANICGKYGIVQANFRFNDLPSVSKLSANPQSLLSNTNTPTPDQQAMRYEQALLAEELKLERAEKRQLIDFAQLRYQGDPTDSLKERLSVGVGLQIPNSGSRKLKIKELSIEQAQLQQAIQTEQLRLQSKQDILYNDLLRRIESYQFFNTATQNERSNLLNLGQKAIELNNYNPLLLLEIEERNIKNELKRLSKELYVFMAYINYLGTTYQLCNATSGEILASE